MSIVQWWRNRGRDRALFPEDENGDVLWQMQKSGDNLSKKRAMNFAFLFPSEQTAKAFQSKAEALGFIVDVSYFDEKSSWDAECSIELAPTHMAVSKVERELSSLARLEKGKPDGWGCMSQ
jgi:hypothetical protein